jgi:hypothetical protein
MHKSEQINMRETTEGLVKVFAAFFTLAYICGYLIASSHLEELGIRSGSVNMIRAKYIWLGFLYLLPLFIVAAMTSLLRLNPTNFLRNLRSRFHRNRRRVAPYRNRYAIVVLLTVVTICSRMMFFDAQWREDTAWLVCIAIAAFLSYQLVHRIELFQTATLDQLSKSTFVFGKTTFANVRETKNDAIHMSLCIDRSHDLKDILCLVSLLSFLGTAYYVLMRTEFHWLPHPYYGFLFRHSDFLTFVSYICTLACLQIQLSTAFHRDSLTDTAAVRLGPADRSIYSGTENDGPAPELLSRKRARWVARTVVMLVLFVASIHGFTHVVYPLIPPERGGGNYPHGTVADVCMRSPDLLITASQPPTTEIARDGSFCASGVLLQDLIILEEDSDAVYAASVYDRGMHSSEGEKAGPLNCGIQEWHVGTNSPRVMSLRESDLVAIHDKDTVEHFCETAERPIKTSNQPDQQEKPKP